MKRAVLYARVSTDAQQKEGTIESQVLELKRQIAAAGDVLVKEYIDNGYSGTRLDRPALEELRKDVKTDLFDAVYFLDTDRIARDVAYQTIILGELIKHGKRIIIKGKDYVNNPENKFTVTVLGAVAELERAKIIERTTRGRLHRLRMGELSSNGHRIYGYHYVKKSPAAPAALVINEEQAPVVRSIFEMFASGRFGLVTISRSLEELRVCGRSSWRGGSKCWPPLGHGPEVPALPFSEGRGYHSGHAEGIVQLPVGEQPAIRGDPSTVNSSLIRRSKEPRRGGYLSSRPPDGRVGAGVYP